MSWRDGQFADPAGSDIERAFLRDGYVLFAVEDAGALSAIRERVVALAASYLGSEQVSDDAAFLNTIHERVAPEDLNALRLHVFEGMNKEPWFRAAYFSLARRIIEQLVGNELAMQLRVNLSVQLPNDDSSLLPIHADVWNGDSPYEIVLWLPMVDCFDTKSMYILPRGASERHHRTFTDAMGRSSGDLFEAVRPELDWLSIKFGQACIFSQNLMHGNIVNGEGETRWSMNCRFKSLLSPYADKKLGEFFSPISIRPVTRMGASYRLPDIAGAKVDEE